MVEGSDSSAITVVNRERETNTYGFNHGAMQTVVNADGIYILDSRTVYRYSLNGFEEVGRTTVDSFWNQHHYISGLFPLVAELACLVKQKNGASRCAERPFCVDGEAAYFKSSSLPCFS